MRRFLLRNASLYTRSLLHHQSSSSSSSAVPLSVSTRPRLRFFSSDEKPKDPVPLEPVDVDNKELKSQIDKYFKGDEDALPSIVESILQRRLSGKHEETDDELMDELSMAPINDVADEEIESDFEDGHETDEEIDDLYNARDIVMKRMAHDEYFNMDDKKWNEIVQDGVNHGFLKDTKECEEILEDMLSWEKLLPDYIKQKVEEKFNELADMCERGELEPEAAYQLYKTFEDELVMEYIEKMEKEEVVQSDDTSVPDKKNKKKDIDDPPGEGPILRWLTRAVFAPGGDAWHPKNRKVKLSVTVKEIGFSKYQFRRLRELVGKRYHPGRDELTITSERFEHREENRKDCLRTLLSRVQKQGHYTSMCTAGYIRSAPNHYLQPTFQQHLFTKLCKGAMFEKHNFLSTTSNNSTEDGSEEEETISVTFVDKDGEEKPIKVPIGMSMLEAAHENDIELEGACEGSLACSTCHVIIMDLEYYNKLEDPTDEENDMLDLAFGLSETSRLGCQVIAKPELDGIRLAIPAATRNFAVDGYVPKPH